MNIAKKKKTPKKKQAVIKKSPEDVSRLREQKTLEKQIRVMFESLGFKRAYEACGKDIFVKGQRGEIDDLFFYENVLLCVEYTVHKSSNISEHIKKKKIFFDNICDDKKTFIDIISENSNIYSSHLKKYSYLPTQVQIIIIYIPKNQYEDNLPDQFPQVVFLSYPKQKYFREIVKCIKCSARSELFNFLKINLDHLASEGCFPSTEQSDKLQGTFLPVGSSDLPDNVKVFSFYASAKDLLNRTFVLRNGGWQSTNSYQRMIKKSKIEEMRKAISTKSEGVFINNIIVSLPKTIAFIDNDNNKIGNLDEIINKKYLSMQIDKSPNSIGIIDGQHRVYCYYESTADTKEIKTAREKQNLLVSGLVFPEDWSDAKRNKYEARIFRVINSKQNSPPPALLQEIEALLNPTSNAAIARKIIDKLSYYGNLKGHIERKGFEGYGIKTASIVSYGLIPLINVRSNRIGLYRKFLSQKEKDQNTPIEEIDIDEYVQFCVSTIGIIFSKIKNAIGSKWKPSSKGEEGILNVTTINSFLILTRLLIERDNLENFKDLKIQDNKILKINFEDYRSSQYSRLAEEIYTQLGF